ncbi:hypothetical protein [Pseudomonas sp. B20]|uniref:hypothetical protein n=1 Tax=Pseudomonas sp. B20 TaxID=129268 RepID=UPI001CFBBA0A|nr:hypothetical protein [Pseudomonas sp. B20]
MTSEIRKDGVETVISHCPVSDVERRAAELLNTCWYERQTRTLMEEKRDDFLLAEGGQVQRSGCPTLNVKFDGRHPAIKMAVR